MARSNLSKMPWYGRCLATGLVVVCATLCGCCNLGMQNQGVLDYDRADWTKEIRPPDARGEFFGSCNEARQIEQHLQRR